ncbi:STOML2 [Cordylochernes scorpioides]|uniref:STOML2 n=1 Tax=Cordylochernes scorpioides TaxID=51811 RepID=A0ABY6KHG2_9ARAC|nr:STOML2 [Cordylochernes scorpioides]
MSQNYNCVAPEPFNFSNPGDWPKWIRRFEHFRQESGLINNPENEQVNMLVYCMGDNADDILLSCKIASDQLENYNKVIECFESHFIPRRNIIYERARFNQRCQQEGEKVNEFITALHSLAEHCNFGMLHDELIRDRIVVGVRDRALSERMQLDTDLTLVKATLMAKQLESVKEQQSSFYQQDSIDQIKKMPNHIKETKRHEPKIRQFKSNQLGGSSHGCTRCGNSNNHDWKNCPAMNSYCSKCKKKGHYAKVCRSEAINEIKSEIAFLGSVEDNSKKLIVPIKVNNRQINFKIDTGADVNVLPLQYYYQSFQRIKLEKSDKILQGPNGIPLETVGMIHVELQNKGQHLNSKIYIVDKLKQPLLSGETSEKLNIVRMIQQLSSGGRGGQRGRLGSGDNRGCYNCGEEGHRKFECTKPARGRGRGRGQSRDGGSNNTCYNCGEVGHRKYECTNNTAEDGGQEKNRVPIGYKLPKEKLGETDSTSHLYQKWEVPWMLLRMASARSKEMRRPPLRHQPGSQGDARMTRSKRPRRIALHQRPHLQEMEGCRGTTKTRIQRRASLQCQPCIQDMEGQSRYLEAWTTNQGNPTPGPEPHGHLQGDGMLQELTTDQEVCVRDYTKPVRCQEPLSEAQQPGDNQTIDEPVNPQHHQQPQPSTERKAQNSSPNKDIRHEIVLRQLASKVGFLQSNKRDSQARNLVPSLLAWPLSRGWQPLVAVARHKSSTPLNTVIMFVPQQEAWVVERMGRFHRILNPGLNWLLPVFDRVKYVQSLKEIAIDVPKQSAITLDNVNLNIDGVLYLKIFDPYKTSYGVEEPEFAITQLAQTTMRSELGKISLDNVFRERESLNFAIVDAINKASSAWGISCLRYEIRDIKLPPRVQEAMQMQVEAERKKRAAVLESEGMREAEINVAEGKKRSRILASEAVKTEQINQALGEAQALVATAEARAKSISLVGSSLVTQSGGNAASLVIAEQYVKAFSQLARTSNTVILPSNTGDISNMVTQAMSVYKTLSNNSKDMPLTHPDPTPDDNPKGEYLSDEDDLEQYMAPPLSDTKPQSN